VAGKGLHAKIFRRCCCADVLYLWLILDVLAGCFTMQISGDLSSEQSQE
jgi:hypothetical protein